MVSSSRRIPEHYALARIEFGVPDKRLAVLRAPGGFIELPSFLATRVLASAMSRFSVAEVRPWL